MERMLRFKQGTLFDLVCDGMQAQGWVCIHAEDWGGGMGENAHFLPTSAEADKIGVGAHIPEALLQEGRVGYVWTYPI